MRSVRGGMIFAIVSCITASGACGGKSDATGPSDGDSGGGSSGGSSGGSGGDGGTIPILPSTSKVDLLFMVDNSVSMGDKQP